VLVSNEGLTNWMRLKVQSAPDTKVQVRFM
jgi:hypothetical protein